MEIPRECPLRNFCVFISNYDNPIKGRIAFSDSGFIPVLDFGEKYRNVIDDVRDQVVSEVIDSCRTINEDCQIVRLEKAVQKLADDSGSPM